VTRPVLPHTVLIKPFLGSGLTEGGLYVEYHKDYPPVVGLVLAAHPTVSLCAEGDVVVYTTYGYVEEDYSGGTLYAMHEDNIKAIIEDYPKEALSAIA
jgi:hypothetical protein